MFDNVNPNNVDAERQVLGSILLDNSLIRKALLTTEDFYLPKHREVYKAMLELDMDGMPIDLITMSEKIKKDDIINISQMANEIVTTANINIHTSIISECSTKRKLKKICMDTIQNLDKPLDELLPALRNQTSVLVKGRGGNIIPMSTVAHNIHEFIERRSKNKDTLSGISSGYFDIDELTDGFQGGDLILLGGRPSSGKSALAMSFICNAAVPAGVISIEMGEHQIGIRTLASLSQVELWKLRKGIVNDSWANIYPALESMANLPIYFSFSSKNTIEIEKIITQMVESYDCKMIMVDYLQLTKSAEAKKREQEVAEVSRLLKVSAQAYNIPIIALSQLNREVERRENKRPMLSDLRESGALEQDADIVVFLYREYPDKDGVVEVIVAKGRNIGLGTVKLYFKGDIMTFHDLTKEGKKLNV